MFDYRPLQKLPDFVWHQPYNNAVIAQYAEYYGIDFSGEFPDLTHCMGSKKLAGQTVAVQAFLRTDNSRHVILLHGYMDHVGLFGHVIHQLLSNGYNVVTLDLPGHGLSFESERAGIESFQYYLDVVKALTEEAMQQLPGDWVLMGQSTGAAIAMDYVLNNPQHGFAKLVLLAPLVRPVQWWWVKIQLFALRPFTKSVPRKFKDNSGNREFLTFIRQGDPLQPTVIRTSWVKALYDWLPHFRHSPASDIDTLVIQGEKDIVVDWQYNLPEIDKKFSRMKAIYLPDANHHLVNETPAIRACVFKEILRFMLEQ